MLWCKIRRIIIANLNITKVISNQPIANLDLIISNQFMLSRLISSRNIQLQEVRVITPTHMQLRHSLIRVIRHITMVTNITLRQLTIITLNLRKDRRREIIQIQ